jgi:DNA-binding MarR family transcriptional regulator
MAQQKNAVKAAEAAQAHECDLYLQINVRLKPDEVAQLEARLVRADARRNPTTKELRQIASRIYDARRTRGKILDDKLFGEPAWDMLLALYCLPARGQVMSITSLTYCADTPQTTGYRWQNVLLAEGLIERGPEGSDARRQIVRLTAKGRILMEEYLTRLFHCEAAIPAEEDALPAPP